MANLDEYSVYSDETLSQALSIKGSSFKAISGIDSKSKHPSVNESASGSSSLKPIPEYVKRHSVMINHNKSNSLFQSLKDACDKNGTMKK
jgi:hypothetical protein